MATRIFPSENDVHDVSGVGRKPTEENLTLLRNTAAAQISHFRDSAGAESVGPGGVLTGYDFSSGTATSIILTAGTATIEGFSVESTTTISAVLTASQFNYVFLTLDDSGGLVTGISLTVRPVASFSSALTIPARSILLWCFETDGVNIITQFDFRTVGTNVVQGSYTGDGAASRTIDIGFRPKLVTVFINEDNKFKATSPVPVPRGSGQQDGLFIGQVGFARCITRVTNDPELVPIIVKNGFVVEDGPAGFSGPIPLEATEVFDPPGIAAAGFLTRTVAVPGALSVGSLVAADLTSMNATQADWEFQGWNGIGGGTVVSRVIGVDSVRVAWKNISPGLRDLGSGTLTTYVQEMSSLLTPWSLNELNEFYFFTAWF